MSAASDLVAARLPREEGEIGMPYKDRYGNLTIGIGTLLPLSHEEMSWLAANRVAKKEAELLPFPWYQQLNDARKSVFLDLAYNMGTDKLLHFVNTLAAVQRGDWQAAHDGLLASKWRTDVGDSRALPLAQILLTGEI